MSCTQTVVSPVVDVDAVKNALQQWGRLTPHPSPLEQLQRYRELKRHTSDSPSAYNRQIPGTNAGLPNQRRIINTLLFDAIALLEGIQPDAARLLTKRFMDGEPIRVLAIQENSAESHIYKRISQAAEALTNVILAQENSYLYQRRELWQQRIETESYIALVGIEEHQETLYQLFCSEEPPWIVSVEGIGGIGKTSLTHSVLTQLLDDCPFDELCWVSAKSEMFSPSGSVAFQSDSPSQSQSIFFELLRQVAPDQANSSSLPLDQIIRILRAHFKAQRALIVIDNLETVSDLETLVPHLESLVNPSRIVLTSRHQTALFQPAQRFIVPELSEDSSLQLIRQESANTELTEVSQYEDEELLPIYQTVGGNPLALRLATGLLHTQSLSDLLISFQNAPTIQADNLYTYIFERSWEQLGDLERQVLVVMPLIQPAGEPQAYLSDVANLSSADLGSALTQLANLNLVQVHREKPAYRYSIHSLTRTFLLNEAIGWK